MLITVKISDRESYYDNILRKQFSGGGLCGAVLWEVDHAVLELPAQCCLFWVQASLWSLWHAVWQQIALRHITLGRLTRLSESSGGGFRSDQTSYYKRFCAWTSWVSSEIPAIVTLKSSSQKSSILQTSQVSEI